MPMDLVANGGLSRSWTYPIDMASKFYLKAGWSQPRWVASILYVPKREECHTTQVAVFGILVLSQAREVV
jgi:hypothetical protein